jgi:hypothetical protein
LSWLLGGRFLAQAGAGGGWSRRVSCRPDGDGRPGPCRCRLGPASPAGALPGRTGAGANGGPAGGGEPAAGSAGIGGMPDGEVFSESSLPGQGTCAGGPGGGAEVSQSGIVPLGLVAAGTGPPVAPAAAAGTAGEGGASARRDGPGHADGGAWGGNDGPGCGSARAGSGSGGSARGGPGWGGSARGSSARDGCGHGGSGPTTVRPVSARSGAAAGPGGLVPLPWLHQVLARSANG